MQAMPSAGPATPPPVNHAELFNRACEGSGVKLVGADGSPVPQELVSKILENYGRELKEHQERKLPPELQQILDDIYKREIHKTPQDVLAEIGLVKEVPNCCKQLINPDGWDMHELKEATAKFIRAGVVKKNWVEMIDMFTDEAIYITYNRKVRVGPHQIHGELDPQLAWFARMEYEVTLLNIDPSGRVLLGVINDPKDDTIKDNFFNFSELYYAGNGKFKLCRDIMNLPLGQFLSYYSNPMEFIKDLESYLAWKKRKCTVA